MSDVLKTDLEVSKRTWNQLSVRELLWLMLVFAIGTLWIIASRNLSVERSRSLELSNRLDNKSWSVPTVQIDDYAQRTASSRYRINTQSWGIGSNVAATGQISIPAYLSVKMPMTVRGELIEGNTRNIVCDVESQVRSLSDPCQFSFGLTLKNPGGLQPGLYILRVHALNGDGEPMANSMILISMQ